MTYSRVKLVNNGMGALGFLCPPGHPNLTHALEAPQRGDVATYALTRALETPGDFPAAVMAEVRALFASAQLVCSEKWVRHVYGYFRNCYSPNGVDRSVVDVTRSGPPEHHLAVLTIREYFPDHQPRLDLIANPGNGYGAWPCTKCGQRVQYEARYDAHAAVNTRQDGTGMTHWSYGVDCPNGGQHEIAD